MPPSTGRSRSRAVTCLYAGQWEGVRAPALTLVWEESGGPEVTLPVRQGYGSELVRELIGYELGGTVELVFARQGVRCALALPISAVSS